MSISSTEHLQHDGSIFFFIIRLENIMKSRVEHLVFRLVIKFSLNLSLRFVCNP